MLKDKKNNNYIKNVNSYDTYRYNINNDILKLYYQFNHLKNIYRQGWLTNLLGMEYEHKIESVADHSWSVTILALTIIEKHNLGLDVLKCMKLSIIHELGEIYAGDYTPAEKISKEEKHRLEENAIDELFKDIEFPNDFKEIWLEYEKQQTEEAIFIREIDKLECILQASSYNLNTQYFNGAKDIKNPILIEILNEVCELTAENQIPLCNRKNNEQ